MFSSGAGSYAAARRVRLDQGDIHTLLFSDVGMEDEDNYRFLHEAAKDVQGATLVTVKDGRDIWQVFKDERFLGNSRLASCSKLLKQKPARAWLDANCDPEDTTIYIGIDWTESHRIPKIEAGYAPWRVVCPLTTAPYLSKADIISDMRTRGLEPPRLYALGFAHANCGGGCVRAGQGQFARLLEVMPTRYKEWEQGEREVREHLDKDVSILKVGTLQEFRERHEARPEQTDLFDIGGCGCFTDD